MIQGASSSLTGKMSSSFITKCWHHMVNFNACLTSIWSQCVARFKSQDRNFLVITQTNWKPGKNLKISLTCSRYLELNTTLARYGEWRATEKYVDMVKPCTNHSTTGVVMVQQYQLSVTLWNIIRPCCRMWLTCTYADCTSVWSSVM